MNTSIDNITGPGPFEDILFPRAPIHRDAGLLARFLTGLDCMTIPDAVLHTAKRVALDTIGCIVAGTDTSLGRKILLAYSEGTSGTGCCVPGTSLSLPPSLAGKVSSWLSDVLDYEDVASGHPSATVIPAALAMTEHLGASPRRFLAGVVAGYEAGLRVHDATQASPEAYRRFAVYHAWHGIAAGAAAMTISGGTEAQFRSALGHAAANTSVPIWYVQYGKPAHALKANYGQMALGGIDAALCARRDIVGPFAMLSDLERGFARIIGSDQFDAGQLSAELGSRWRTAELSIKFFPCCAFLHTSVDAAATLANTHHIDPDEIESISVRCISRITDWFSDPSPASEIDAQLSIEYVTAMGLLSREPGRHWYAPEIMESPAVAALMQKTRVELDPIADEAFWAERKYRSTVVLRMKDGRSFTETVDWAPGHWRRPVSDSMLEEKFLNNLRDTPLEKRGDKIIEAVMTLDKSESMSALFGLLRV
ncbi:MmgE/PrpD family protein [Allomesorhizobium camelthorni]|uniref:MmgE/PrpD family protein n=1 Tax=Allomesorhizobium camelthorni TaxID=475069 RepID=A0A6G4WH12_9HYPH|nr:MmgE/PrpD family protein [Mesorhizobium camelthorni]NGO53894.1 MmgE/PrpD family protein [Mesorhizobium camelthorni]